MPLRFKTRLSLLFVAGLAAGVQAQTYLALNAGFSAQSVLGISLGSGRNEFNAGLKGFAFGSSGFRLRPGLTYNRYFTDDGWYGTLSYAPAYRRGNGEENGGEKGWESGNVLLGAGKNFQFTSWGINIDGGLVSPNYADEDPALDVWFGLGASYRFRLN